MHIKLVEIMTADTSWKGTWYRIGQRYFVRQDPDWPRVMSCRWKAVFGGIHEEHCRVVRGPVAWLRCLVRSIWEAVHGYG